MKRLITFILVVVSLFTVGCNKEPEKQIESITIEESFYSNVIYVGDIVDFSSYDFIICYDNGESETVDYSNIVITGFSTELAGSHEFTIVYKGFSFKQGYTVVEPTLMNCRYNGDVVNLYKGEEIPDNYTFIALYSNGEELTYKLKLAQLLNSENVLTAEGLQMQFVYQGVTFEVPCTITYRPIELNKEYVFEDETGLYTANDIKISITGSEAVLFASDRSETYDTIAVNISTFNRYTTIRIIGGNFETFDLYLMDEVVHLVKHID